MSGYDGVIVVAHGSRAAETEQAFMAVLQMAQAQLPGLMVEPAFMQLSEQSLAQAVAKLAGQGVQQIKVVPYFLFTGVHIKQDIPEMLEAFEKEYPDIQFTLGRPLGVDGRLAEILVDRINE